MAFVRMLSPDFPRGQDMADLLPEKDKSPAPTKDSECEREESLGNPSAEEFARAKKDAGSEPTGKKAGTNLPSIVLDPLPPAKAAENAAKAVAVIPGKVIEVPPSDELDSPDWHKHRDPPPNLPGSFIKQPRIVDPPDPRVEAALGKILPDEIKKQLSEITGNEEVVINGKKTRLESRSTHGPGYELALQYFKDKFEKEGYTVSMDPYTRWGETYYNLRATKVGRTKPEEVVLYGAHIDSTAGDTWTNEKVAPGASDDGTGVVALAQIAKAIKDLPLDRTVVFALFSGEEQGLWGSRAMAENYRIAQVQVANDLAKMGVGADASKDNLKSESKSDPKSDSSSAAQAAGKAKIIAMYQIDMIGYAPNSNTVESHDTPNHKPSHDLTELLAAKQAQYRLDLKVYGAHNDELTNRSDHYPFFRLGVPAVLLTEPYDTATQHNPHYHSVTDTLDKVNIPFVTNITKAAAAAGIELAGLPKGPVKPATINQMLPLGCRFVRP